MRIIRLSDTEIDAAAQEAAKALADGGIVLYPTDTLYGLGVDAANVRALELLRHVKGREKKKPISVVVPHVDAIEEHAHLSEVARALAEHHLPGALTLVLAGKDTLPAELMLNGAIGVRVPDHPFTSALARVFGRPFTATSANRSGHAPSTNVLDIIRDLGPLSEHLTVVIDAGEHPGGTPSTVVHAVGDTFYILREGAISREDLGL